MVLRVTAYMLPILPPQPDDTVVEFYIHAIDAALNTRTYPAPSQPTGEQLTNLLYQVDDSVYSGDQPIFRLIMTEAERAELADIGSDPSDGIAEQDSDAQMNGTFISMDGTGTEVRYNVGIRNRGKGSRNDQPNNYRVNLPADRPWHDVTAVVFNGRFSGLEVVGSEILRFANVPAQDAVPAQVRINNSDLAAQASPNFRMFGSYGFLESLDSEFADNHYPQDSSGNLYRGFDELIYRGEDPDAYRAELHNGVGYEKHTNNEEDDWTDLIELTRTFDPIETPDDNDFVAQIQNLIDVDQWIKAAGAARADRQPRELAADRRRGRLFPLSRHSRSRGLSLLPTIWTRFWELAIRPAGRRSRSFGRPAFRRSTGC